ncbi:MAG: hypothetical protein ABSH08_10580 [Tepidisphaeraceae bacterium]|jgi:hypothetical protein
MLMTSDHVTPQPLDVPPKVAPIDYASPGLAHRSRLFTVIGIVSILVACFSLLVSGNCEWSTIQDLSASMRDISAAKALAARYSAAYALANSRPAPRGLTEAEIKAVIAYALNHAETVGWSSYRGPLQPAQIKTLSLMLAAPGQVIIDAQLPIGPPNFQQTVRSHWEKDGDFYIQTDYDDPTLGLPAPGAGTEFRMLVHTTGEVSDMWFETPGKVVVTPPSGATASYLGYLWRPPWDTTSPVPPEIQSTFDGRLLVLAIFAINLALAALLLVAAALLLARRRGGVWLHRAYALAKLPASIAGGIAIMWEIASTPGGMLFPVMAIPGLLGCVYPVTLLITLRGEAVQQHECLARGSRTV